MSDRCPECDLPYALCNAVASVRERFMDEVTNWGGGEYTREDAWYLAKPFEAGARKALLEHLTKAPVQDV